MNLTFGLKSGLKLEDLFPKHGVQYLLELGTIKIQQESNATLGPLHILICRTRTLYKLLGF